MRTCLRLETRLGQDVLAFITFNHHNRTRDTQSTYEPAIRQHFFEKELFFSKFSIHSLFCISLRSKHHFQVLVTVCIQLQQLSLWKQKETFLRSRHLFEDREY